MLAAYFPSNFLGKLLSRERRFQMQQAEESSSRSGVGLLGLHGTDSQSEVSSMGGGSFAPSTTHGPLVDYHKDISCVFIKFPKLAKEARKKALEVLSSRPGYSSDSRTSPSRNTLSRDPSSGRQPSDGHVDGRSCTDTDDSGTASQSSVEEEEEEEEEECDQDGESEEKTLQVLELEILLPVLHHLFGLLDRVAKKHRIERIKTIGWPPSGRFSHSLERGRRCGTLCFLETSCSLTVDN